MSRMLLLYLLSLTIRSILLAAVTGFILLPVRKVHIRHAMWTVVLCVVIVLPIADSLTPQAIPTPTSFTRFVAPVQTMIAFAPQPTLQRIASATPTTKEQSVNWWELALLLFVAVTIFLCLRLILVFRSVMLTKRKSRRISSTTWEELRATRPSRRAISLCESGAATVPLTVGLWKPLLILPLNWHDWDEWKLRAVLTHEMTHIERMDWAIAALAALAKCIYWFNPLVWWIERKLSSLAEHASDEACVRYSGDRRRYAETLLYFATTARHGHRWIGGLAMANHKISLRIERVLSLQNPGCGVLPRIGWATLLLLAMPALYVSAIPAEQPMVSISPPEIRAFLQHEIAPIESPSETALQQTLPQTPAPPVTPQPQSNTGPQPAAPQVVEPRTEQTSPSPEPPKVVNPDIVGEIRLILAPVDAQTPQGQVEITTQRGTNRFTGNAIWNVRNSALNPATWNSNNAFSFSLAGIDGRKMLFEDTAGRTFSYGCADCSILVWESGVGLPTGNGVPGFVFQLSADGKSVSATCRAKQCQIALSKGSTTFLSDTLLTLQNAETRTFGIINLTCFSVFGAVKADGTPLTPADCNGGSSLAFYVMR